MMSKTILAEYDAEHKTLKLEEPLEGIKDHEKLKVAVEEVEAEGLVERPWMKLEGSLSPEAGESLSRAIDELYGPINRGE
jgi:glutamate synthase domain-containing protein 2